MISSQLKRDSSYQHQGGRFGELSTILKHKCKNVSITIMNILKINEMTEIPRKETQHFSEDIKDIKKNQMENLII